MLNKLAEQVIEHFKTYLKDEDDIIKVLLYYQSTITSFIITQLRQHYIKPQHKYMSKVTHGFTALNHLSFALERGRQPIDFRNTPAKKSAIRQLHFGGFTKCCYPIQKFDSVDGELRFAQLLENDSTVIKWMKPNARDLRIEYHNGKNYEPDFVVETKDAKYICEIKRASEIDDKIVLSKQQATNNWCAAATQHAIDHNSKKWYYLLIPHDEINHARILNGLISEYLSKEPV